MVVSHDRNFVNNVITDVIHLHNQVSHNTLFNNCGRNYFDLSLGCSLLQSLVYYRGDYETFERVRLEQQKNQVCVQMKRNTFVNAIVFYSAVHMPIYLLQSNVECFYYVTEKSIWGPGEATCPCSNIYRPISL